jgi:beta-lactamase regulating signal transducer with metallopeptidase domain
MKALATDLLAYLAEPALRSLAVASVAALVIAAIPARRAVVRLFIWTGVLYVALAMPVLGTFLPHIRMAVPAGAWQREIWQTKIWQTKKSSAASAVPVADDSFANVAGSDFAGNTTRPRIAHARPAQPSGVPQAQPSMSNTPPAAQAEERAAGSRARVLSLVRHVNWRATTVALYFLGFAILLMRMLLGIRVSHRLTRRAEDICAKYFPRKDEVEDAHTSAALDLLSRCSRAARLKVLPHLKESTALVVPATVGIRRPVVLLPADWRSWTDEKLRAVLAHEISHVARRDALTQILSLLHRAVFWFSPLAWWLDMQLAELAEQASDEAALAGGTDRTFYAETLLGFFLRLDSVPGRIRWHLLSMAHSDGFGQAERRVNRILAWKGPAAMKKSLVLGVIAVAAPVILVAASLHPFAAGARSQAQTDAKQAVPPAPTQPAKPSPASDVRPDATDTRESKPAEVPEITGSREERAEPWLEAQSSEAQNALNVREGSYHMGSGSRWVFIKANSRDVSMSGDDEDLQHARRLRDKIKGDFIWFERDEKSYVITDPAFLARVTALWAPQDALSKQQDELARQQDELGRQQDALGAQQEKISVKIPDIRPELERIRLRLNELQASGATQRELGSVQSQLGELQSRIGRLQSAAGREQSVFGRQQADLGRKQGELGKRQGELGRRQGELARQASRELRGMFDDAITKGIAKPE